MNSSKIIEQISVAEFCYATIFLGFVAYQTLVYSGIIPNLLGGSFTFFLILTFPFLLFKEIKQWKDKIALKFIRRLWFLFLAIFALYLAYGFFVEVNPLILFSNVLALIRFFVMYFIFKNINTSSKIIRGVSIVVLLVVFLLVLLSPGHVHTDVLEFEENSLFATDSFQIDYQTMGALVLIASFIASDSSSYIGRLVIFIIALLSLLGCGARFELIAFIVCMGIRELKLLGAAKFFIYFLVLTVLGTLIYFLVYMSKGGVMDLKQGIRIFQLIEDGSINDRLYLFYEATHVIRDNFLFGDYANYNPGAYAHNIISAWVDMGFIGFFALSLIYFSSIYLFYKNYLIKRRVYKSFAFLMIVSSFMAASFSKHYTNIYLPIMVGAIVAHFSNRKHV